MEIKPSKPKKPAKEIVLLSTAITLMKRYLVHAPYHFFYWKDGKQDLIFKKDVPTQTRKTYLSYYQTADWKHLGKIREYALTMDFNGNFYFKSFFKI